ncbi:hypothetical protein [Methyloversatilis sp.]|uniref:hypothetical protein n=1 Tax=Methyloversatilis sp. TaxID=2569862 RepID=UPI0035AEFE83
MILQILSFFGFNASVDAVMSQFKKTIERLEKVQEKQFEIAQAARDRIAKERETAATADKEADRAAQTAQKLKAIIE